MTEHVLSADFSGKFLEQSRLKKQIPSKRGSFVTEY